MKKLHLLSLLFLSAIKMWAQSDSDVNYHQVNGSVMQMRVKTAAFSETGERHEEQPFTANYSKDRKLESIYAAVDDKARVHRVYFYNSEGLLATENEKRGDTASETISYKYKDGSVKERVYMTNGKESRRVVCTGNASGKPEQEWHYKNSRPVEQHRFVYDPEGNLTATMIYDSTGKVLLGKRECTFDKHRNPLEQKRYKGKQLAASYTYEYEYDKQYNWTRRVMFNNGKMINEVVREIAYYK
ncbi:MAG: hypothetical protein JNL72_11085 [Flavipsychrobacter sp.]|nr:hypothetical protein [Flavipsychrobacter sp.]